MRLITLTLVSKIASVLLFACTILPVALCVKHAFGQTPQDLIGHQRPVRALAFSPDGTILASGSDDGTVRFWDGLTGKPKQVIRAHRLPVLTIRFSPDGKILASGSFADGLKLWNVGNGSLIASLPLPLESGALVSSLAFTSDGKKLAAAVGRGSRFAASQSELFVWELPSRIQLQKISTPFSEGPQIALTADGREVVFASGRSVGVYDLLTGAKRLIAPGFTPGFVNAMALSPDGTTLAVGCSHKEEFQGQKIDKHQIQLYAFATGQEMAALKGHESFTLCLAFTPDGKRIVSSSRDGTVKLWDVASGQELASLAGNVGSVHSVAVSPDGKKLAAGGDNGTVQLWTLPRP
ncbi:MAG TPA: WD40 repeat domain-containing protein [Gemmataceae bacterium]|nr:WD40 repeat domain-containing protein [Gemmataceae bacterium]